MPTFPNYPSGQPAAQTLFGVFDGLCPETVTYLANVITGPKVACKIREVDTTAHPTVQTSQATIPATFIPVIREYNMTFDLSIKTDTAQYDRVVQLAKSSTFANFQIVDADSLQTQTLFSGFFTQFDLDRPVAGMVKATCAVRISGDVEYGRGN